MAAGGGQTLFRCWAHALGAYRGRTQTSRRVMPSRWPVRESGIGAFCRRGLPPILRVPVRRLWK